MLRLVSNKQYIMAIKEQGFAVPVSADLERCIKGRTAGAFTTNIDEEFVGLVKNSSEAKVASRFRRPEASMGRVLASGQLEKRLGYDFVKEDTPSDNAAARLPAEAFKGTKDKWSFDFSKVQSSSSTPAWHSPSATNFSVNIADLWFVRDLDKMDA